MVSGGLHQVTKTSLILDIFSGNAEGSLDGKAQPSKDGEKTGSDPLFGSLLMEYTERWKPLDTETVSV